MEELVSVIVPVYNVEKYVGDCIESLIRQSYKNIEIILVDDGSTDSSGQLCDVYATKDIRIKVIHKENGGLSDARNAGIDSAVGVYYSFVDGDDFLAKDAILKMIFGMKEKKCDISVCNMIRYFENGETEPFYIPSNTLKVLNSTDRFETLSQPSVCNKIFKADLFNSVRFPKGKFYEDTFVYHTLVYNAKTIVLTGYDGYFYRSRHSSILGQNVMTDRYFDFIEAVWLRTTFLLKKNIQPYGDEACLSLYAAVANAEKNISRTEENRYKHFDALQKYMVAYEQLIKSKNISLKQKIRLWLLRYFPKIHNILY
jgi:hypothetical protein